MNLREGNDNRRKKAEGGSSSFELNISFEQNMPFPPGGSIQTVEIQSGHHVQI